METKIILKDMHIFAYHGALPQEHVVGSDFLLNLEVSTDFSAAMRSDCLSDTIDYGHIYEVVCQSMQQPSLLLEHAGGRICQALFETFPTVTSLHLTLLKVTPPITGCDGAGMGIDIKITR